MFKKLIFLTLFYALYSSNGAIRADTRWDVPIYEGGLYGGFRWLYLLPTVSDGDLQYGTALTLTGPPLTVDETQNLTAHVQHIAPDDTSAYRAHLGYALPCTNSDIALEYFHFKTSDRSAVTSPIRNAETYQFLQNFLGGGYVSAQARDSQQIEQADLLFGNQYLLDGCLSLRPFYGLSLAYIERHLDMIFNDFVVPPLVAPISATLTGSLNSRYWGVGPTVGTDFSFPLFPCLELTGRFGLSLLGSNTSSKIASNSVRDALFQQFDADRSHFRFTPIIRSELGLAYRYPICNNLFILDVSAGYEVDYYFHVVDRINPDNGYVNNPNTSPKSTTSHIGLGGPYAQVALNTRLNTCSPENLVHIFSSFRNPECGYYLNVENSWLEPSPTSKDLTYGILHDANGLSKDQAVHPDHSWSGNYHLGYRSPCDMNLDLGYRYFHNSKRGSVTAAPGEDISSLNASGPAGVLFSHASSLATYELHQADLSIGKYMDICSPLSLHGFVGLRYLDLERMLHNSYAGGVPGTLTESKFPTLKSHYWGIGPLMGCQPTYHLCSNLGVTGLFDVALLVGRSNAKLDQTNFGTLPQETSNTLRTDNIQTIVPMIETKIGLFWTFNVCRCLEFNLEAGYFFSDYFKAVNLVFPNFLTGLEQNNSDLLLSGPYLSLNISGF